MNFYSVLSGKLSPRWASLFALLNISGGLSKDWKPPRTQNLLLRLCLSLNCSNTAFGLFYFLPMNLGQELEAFQVLESKSKACPRWAVALDSPVTVPKDDSHVSVCSCFDGAEHERVPPGDPRADLLCAAGCHSLSKASRGLERGFVGGSLLSLHTTTTSRLRTQCISWQSTGCTFREWCFKQGVTRWLFLVA